MLDKKYLHKKLKEIDISISENYHQSNQVGVLSGASGLSMYHFYYAHFLNDERQSDKALIILSNCIEQVNNGNIYPTYCTGLSGFGWVANHLNQVGYIEMNENLLVEANKYIYQAMQAYLKDAKYDFLHGALGCGFYFLKLYKNTTSKELKFQYKKYLLELIDYLLNLSEIDERGIKWLLVIDNETGEKGCNLSLSHGISSIINFLSRLYLYEDFKNSVESMLKGGVSYILSYKSKDIDSIAIFPNYIKSDDEKIVWNSRVAWCYGDLGIGLSLWKAAKALEDEEFEKETIDILKHTSKRRLPQSTMVNDAGLCHGSFGNVQIFQYMYRQTKIEEFKTAADFWINDGLDKLIHNDGYAGYKMWTQEGWKNELSVLEGIAGIGLAIISYLSEEDTNWDECLMIS